MLEGTDKTLSKETMVMHDHSSINYNDRFSFLNIECNAHLQRNLQKIVDETGHARPKKLKELISATIKDRNDLISNGGTGFEDSYVEGFHSNANDGFCA